MKKQISNILLGLIIITAILISTKSKGQEIPQVKKPDLKTNMYIRNAINNERNLSVFNYSCSEQAKKQGFINVAKSFEQIAKAEDEMYKNLKEIAKNLKIEYPYRDIKYPIMSTVENIKKAISLEQLSARTYQNAVNKMKDEGINPALDCFDKNLKAKQKFADDLKELLNSINK